MAQRQFRIDDTSTFGNRYGSGVDGDLNVTSGTTTLTYAAQTSCSGTGSTNTLTVADTTGFIAGYPVLIHQTRGATSPGAGNWEFNEVSSIGGGSLTLTYPLIQTYTDSGGDQAQVIQLRQYQNVSVSAGATLNVGDWGGNVGGILAMLVSGTVTVDGTISANEKGYQGGGAATGNFEQGHRGEGNNNAGGSQDSSADGTAGGAGIHHADASRPGAGGGGHAAGGSNGTQHNGVGSNGQGGGTGGNAGLTVMIFGGAGGSGKADSGEDSSPGGDSGGIILIVARTITVNPSTGLITTNGGTPANTGEAGGGGGGSGGSILLKGQTVSLGTNRLTVTNGNGSFSSSTGDGGDGAVGRIHVDYSASLSGTATPTIDSRIDSILQELPIIGDYTFFM